MRAAAALVAGALLAWPATAAAYNTEQTPITDHTAYTLPQKSFRLGLWSAEYSLFDSLTVGTYWPAWFARVASLHAKWRFWQPKPVTLAVYGDFFRLDTKHLKKLDQSAGSAVITSGTFEPRVSWRIDPRFDLGGSVTWTQVSLDGTLHKSDFDGAGSGAVSNMQLTATFEWRLTRVTTLALHARYLVFQRVAAGADASFRPDAFTTVEVHGNATSDVLYTPHAFSLLPAVALSWKHLNLRFGIGYGNWNVPGLNFVLDHKTVIGELDAYWTW